MSESLTKAGNQEHSLTLLISHSLTLNMLNNFSFYDCPQNSLFIGENVSVFSWDNIMGVTLSPDVCGCGPFGPG